MIDPRVPVRPEPILNTLFERIATLQAENERQRQALEEIALETQGGMPSIKRDELVHITAVDALAPEKEG